MQYNVELYEALHSLMSSSFAALLISSISPFLYEKPLDPIHSLSKKNPTFCLMVFYSKSHLMNELKSNLKMMMPYLHFYLVHLFVNLVLATKFRKWIGFCCNIELFCNSHVFNEVILNKLFSTVNLTHIERRKR